MRSLRTRLTLALSLLVLTAFVLTSLLAWRVVHAAVTRDFEARLASALSELASGVGRDASGLLSLERTPDDPLFNQSQSGWYWLISEGGRVVARSRSLPPGDQMGAVAAAAIGGANVDVEELGKTLRVFTQKLSLRGQSAEPLLAHVAGPIRTVTNEVWRAMRPLLMALGVVAALLILAVGIELRRGLRPLVALSMEIARASRGEAAHISETGFREIDPVVQGINHLINQMTGVVDRARAQAGNLAHAIKTPLSLISARNQAGDGRSDQDIRISVDMIERQLDRHLKRTRFAGRVGLAAEPVAAEAVIDDIVLVMRRTYELRGLIISSDIAPGAAFLVEREDLEEMIGNLADNACKWARTQVELSVRATAARQLRLIVDDDGPGLPPEARQPVLARGHRLDDAVAGSGLGLAIVRELAQLYNGTIDLSESDLGGLRATLCLPSPLSAADI